MYILSLDKIKYSCNNDEDSPMNVVNDNFVNLSNDLKYYCDSDDEYIYIYIYIYIICSQI